MKETVDGSRRIFEHRMHARRRVVQLARLGGVQLARRQMQIGHMADRRLRLVRHQLDAVRIGQRDAAHQAGDAAHLDDVGLHHPDPGRDQIRQPGERVGLFAGRDRDVEPLRHFAHCLHMVVLHRLLEPPIAELFEHAPDAYRAADRVAVIGVEGEREIIPDQTSHRARLGNIAGDVDVGLGAVVVEADLDRRRLVLQPRFDDAQHLVDAALAIAADRGVERQAGAPGAAEQLVDRLIEQLALQVPQRNVERRQRAGQRPFGSELDEGVQQCVEQHRMIERVLADQRRRQIVLDDPERGEPALHRRRLADAERAVVAMNSDPSAALRGLVLGRPLNLKHFDFADLHGVLLRHKLDCSRTCRKSQHFCTVPAAGYRLLANTRESENAD